MRVGLVGACAAGVVFAGCSAQNSSGPVDEKGPVVVGEEVFLSLSNPKIAAPAQSPSSEATLAWSETITQPDATYIAVHFSRFNLPEGTYLVLRDPSGSHQKVYRGEGKVVDGTALPEFWGQHVIGSEAIIELYSDREVAEGVVAIDKMARGLKAFDDLAADMVESPERICGSDDSEWAKCYQDDEAAAYNRSRAVARLLINGTGGCTGWLVGDEGHLMTNNHCISTSSQAANTSYEFMAEGATCSTDCASGGACEGVIEADSATLIRTNSSLDYALVKLPENITSTYGYMQMRDTGAVQSERIYIPQHPARWGKRIAMYSTADEGGVCRVVSLTEPGCTGSGNDVGYFCDTQGGSSGSPVLGYEDNLVVALHHCGTCENRGVPIDKVIEDLGDDLPSNAVAGGGPRDEEPPTVSFEAPTNGETVFGVVVLTAAAQDNDRVADVSFMLDGALIGSATEEPYAIDWNSANVENGSYTLEVVAVDPSGNSASESIVVIVENSTSEGKIAEYDANLGAPACHEAAFSCDSGELLQSRGNVSNQSEANAPNTLHGSCTDGNSGVHGEDKSIERIQVANDSSEDIGVGDTITVNVDAFIWKDSTDRLDIYYTNDATSASPEWQLAATLTPNASGLQSFAASYTVPEGSLQAVRANLRYRGQPSPCSNGRYNDADDLVFSVVEE